LHGQVFDWVVTADPTVARLSGSRCFGEHVDGMRIKDVQSVSSSYLSWTQSLVGVNGKVYRDVTPYRSRLRGSSLRYDCDVQRSTRLATEFELIWHDGESSLDDGQRWRYRRRRRKHLPGLKLTPPNLIYLPFLFHLLVVDGLASVFGSAGYVRGRHWPQWQPLTVRAWIDSSRLRSMVYGACRN
jgi:hypothetical protein